MSLQFDPSQLDSTQQYKLLSGTIIPRPIALVTTLGPKGPNAAPFSLFNMVGVDPPMVMFSMSPRDGGPKDTARNLSHLPEFVIHVVNEAVMERMNVCSADYEWGVNEIEQAGFEVAPSVRVRPPRLPQCPAQFECRLIQMLEVGRRPNTIVIGEVVHLHYNEGMVDPRTLYVDARRLSPIGRLEGAGGYTRITDRFTMLRPAHPRSAGS